MIFADPFKRPSKDEIGPSGVGPAKWVRCRKHTGEEFLLTWVDSLQTWLGECRQCKPLVHEPQEDKQPQASEPAYELVSRSVTLDLSKAVPLPTRKAKEAVCQ